MATKNKYSRETIRELGKFPRHFDEFTIGDAVRVSLRIKEGNRERIQVFEGDVIAMHNKGASSSFVVRKIAVNQVAVERIFPYYSPVIESVTFVSKGRVRRAKLYYIRERIGKAARVKEKILTKEEKRLLAERVKRNRHVKEAETAQAQAIEEAAGAPEVVETAAEEKTSE